MVTPEVGSWALVDRRRGTPHDMSGGDVSDKELGDVSPKRFGLNYDPPSIILEYLQVSTGKLFHRQITLKRLRASTDPVRVAERLRQKNKTLLAEDKVSFDQIVTLVSKLQIGLGAGKAAGFSPAGGLFKASSPLTSSNGASATAPGVAGAVGLEAANVVNAAVAREEEGPSTSAPGSPSAQAPALELDLNELGDEELAQHKARMDVMFFKNQKKPTDDGFVYDVQVDYPDGTDPNGWDDSDEAGSEDL